MSTTPPTDDGYDPAAHWRSADGRGTKQHPTCQGQRSPCAFPYCFDWSFSDDEIASIRRAVAPLTLEEGEP